MSDLTKAEAAMIYEATNDRAPVPLVDFLVETFNDEFGRHRIDLSLLTADGPDRLVLDGEQARKLAADLVEYAAHLHPDSD